MKEYIDLGHMVKVKIDCKYFLPRQAVIKGMFFFSLFLFTICLKKV